jgi:hypothetical protein
MHILFGILIAGLPLVAVELLLEFITIPPEWSRKLVHMLGAAVLILLAHWLTLHELAVVSPYGYGGRCTESIDGATVRLPLRQGRWRRAC